MVWALRQLSGSTKPNDMTLGDCNSTRQNFNEQRRGNLKLNTIQMPPRGSPVSLLQKKLISPPKHVSSAACFQLESLYAMHRPFRLMFASDSMLCSRQTVCCVRVRQCTVNLQDTSCSSCETKCRGHDRPNIKPNAWCLCMWGAVVAC